MDNKEFVFCRYIDERDSWILYDEYSKYCHSNIQPYFSSVGIGMKKEDFLSNFHKFAQKQYRPPIIVNTENNKPCGIYRITYCRANRYHELTLHFWEKKDLAKPVLKQIIDEALQKNIPEVSLLITIPGYEPELKEAAESLGLEPVGTIPNYLCHDDELHHKHIYVITSDKWYFCNYTSERSIP